MQRRWRAGIAPATACARGGRWRLCELCVAPVGQCLPVPARLSDIEAASLPETFFTVWSNVFDRGRLQPARRCSCRAAQRHRRHRDPAGQGGGATVHRDRRLAEKAAACRALGADHAINYKTQDFVAEVQRITGGKRRRRRSSTWSPATTSARELKCLAETAASSSSRCRAAIEAQIDAGRCCAGASTITGSTLRPRRSRSRRDRAGAAQDVWPWLERARQAGDPPGLPGRAGGQAHALMESNQHIGKLVLQW
jgi:NADPH2:quinone reductase